MEYIYLLIAAVLVIVVGAFIYVNVNLTMYIFACLMMHNFTRFQKLNDA